MIYTDHDKLTIIEMENGNGDVAFDVLEKVIRNRPSNIIYCESREGRLCGIISMGDVARADEKGLDYVTVNRNFTSIRRDGYMKAKELFRQNPRINALPVVTDHNGLLGSYSRWDDPFYQVDMCDMKYVCSCRDRIFLVSPCREFIQKRTRFQQIGRAWLCSGVSAVSIAYNEIADYIESGADIFVFVDEDECRAIETLYKYILHEDCETVRFYSVHRFIEECQKEFFGDYFRCLRQKDVYIYNLVWNHNQQNEEYSKMLMDTVGSRCEAIGKKVDNILDPAMYREFFDDLYTESYAKNILDIGYYIETKSGCGKLKDFCSGLYNVTEGERHTDGQPDCYERTVWFVGACYIFGYYAEDRNTIESLLQKRLNDNGYHIRVVNCGSPSYSEDLRMLCARVQTLPLKRGDILIIGYNRLRNIGEINLLDTCMRHNVPAKWIVDHPHHCNHRVYSLYADAIYEELEPVLKAGVEGRRSLLEKNGDFIRDIYINNYLGGIRMNEDEKTGCIVMNCNPFTYGHRYLIEQALRMVDFLIIFVVEEDKSLFSFAERFAMVQNGVRDLTNVMAVPSGPFILSRTTFPEYFLKAADEDLVENVENDITLFAERIAPCLNITYRFVGEEPEDPVTKEYNLAMKRILPQKGIQVLEIPRKKQNDSYISASAVRRHLENCDMGRLKELVPESTVNVLFAKNE